MEYGQDISLYAIYIMPFALTNTGDSINGIIVDPPGDHTVDLKTPSGELIRR
jgi:hypothetical protein